MFDLLLIFIITLAVRTLSAMVGGAGMILIPTLIFFGLPPSMAIATNRVGGLATNISLIQYAKRGYVKWNIALYLAIPAMLGGLLGALVVVDIDQAFFEKLLGVVILGSVPLLLINKKIGLTEKTFTKARLFWAMPLALAAGFMGGMFAATGIWTTFVYLFVGLTMTQVAATRKISNFLSSIASLSVFIIAGIINWPVAIVMFVASGIGAWMGVVLGLKKGNLWVKRLFIIVIIASAIKLLFF